MFFPQAGAPSHTGSVREVAYLAAVMKIKSQSDGKPQCKSLFPLLFPQCSELHFTHWKTPGKFCTVSDEDKVGVWKRGEQYLVTPRSKEVRTQRGSCPAGEGSCLEWPRSLSIATQWASLFSDRRSPSLLLHSRAPCGIRLRLRLLLKCQLCLTPTPPLSCTLLLCQFFYLAIPCSDPWLEVYFF